MLRLPILALCKAFVDHLVDGLNFLGSSCKVLLSLSHGYRRRFLLSLPLIDHVYLTTGCRQLARFVLHWLMEDVGHSIVGILLLFESSHHACHWNSRFGPFRISTAFAFPRDHTGHHRIARRVVHIILIAATVDKLTDSLGAWAAMVRTLADWVLAGAIAHALRKLHLVKRLLAERVCNLMVSIRSSIINSWRWTLQLFRWRDIPFGWDGCRWTWTRVLDRAQSVWLELVHLVIHLTWLSLLFECLFVTLAWLVLELWQSVLFKLLQLRTRNKIFIEIY